MINSLNNPATDSMMESIRIAFTALPEEFLRTLQNSIIAELDRRAAAAPCRVIEEAELNLATGTIESLGATSNWLVKRLGVDLRGTVATLQTNLDLYLQRHTDHAVVEAMGLMDPFVELLASMEPVIELEDESIAEMFEQPLLALVSRAVKKECDRRASMISCDEGSNA